MLQNQKKDNLFDRSGWKVWELKLKDENMVPYGQLIKVANYIDRNIKVEAEKSNRQICFYTTGEYRPVYNYIFSKYYQDLNIKRISFSSDINEECLFLAIDHRQRRDIPRIPKDHQDEFEKIEGSKKEIGFVTVWNVVKKTQDASDNIQINYKLQELSGVEQRAGNRDQVVRDNEQKIMGGKLVDDEKINTSLHSGQVEKMEQVKSKKPRRQERVRWKDLAHFDWK